jgi:hypothetical protein
MTSPPRATFRRQVTALLVEDEESLRRLLARALTEDAFVVVEAANDGELRALPLEPVLGNIDATSRGLAKPWKGWDTIPQAMVPVV